MSAALKIQENQIIFGRFEIKTQIGKGKNSTVYQALDSISKTQVALKILDPFLVQDEVSLERFKRELHILRQLQDQHIIKVFDFHVEGEVKAISMEYFPSLNLKQQIDQRPMTQAQTINLMTQIFKCVHTCHQAGVIHRDLKPQNILVGPNFDFRLIDFGVSRINTMSDLTKTGTVIGTPEYMASESFHTSHVDLRADIYSLGVIFFELLTGKLPVSGRSLSEVLRSQLEGKFLSFAELNTEVPPGIESIVNRCLKVAPEERYQNIGIILKDLGQLASASRDPSKNTLLSFTSPKFECSHCKKTKSAALDFCEHCGEINTIQLNKGKHSLVLSRADQSKEVESEFLRLFPKLNQQKLHQTLQKLPVVLVQGADQSSLERLAATLFKVPVDYTITPRVATKFQMSPALLFSAIAIFAATAWFFQSTYSYAVAGVIIELIILERYFARSMPLLQAKQIQMLTQKELSPHANKHLARFKKLGDLKIRGIFAHLLISYQKQSDKAAPHPLSDENEKILGQAFLIAEEADLKCLSFRDGMYTGYRRKIEQLNLSIKKSTNPREIEVLITEKTKMAADLKIVREQQEQYGDCVSQLLGILEAIELQVGAS